MVIVLAAINVIRYYTTIMIQFCSFRLFHLSSRIKRQEECTEPPPALLPGDRQ